MIMHNRWSNKPETLTGWAVETNNYYSGTCTAGTHNYSGRRGAVCIICIRQQHQKNRRTTSHSIRLQRKHAKTGLGVAGHGSTPYLCCPSLLHQIQSGYPALVNRLFGGCSISNSNDGDGSRWWLDSKADTTVDQYHRSSRGKPRKALPPQQTQGLRPCHHHHLTKLTVVNIEADYNNNFSKTKTFNS